MTREEIEAKLAERGFSVTAYGNNGEGELITIHAITNPLQGACYGCDVYPATDKFELIYAVPKSINVLRSGECSPFVDDSHFENIRSKFKEQVDILYNHFGTH